MKKLVLAPVLLAALSLFADEKTPDQCVATVDYEALIAETKAEHDKTPVDYTAAMKQADDCIRLHPSFDRAYAKRARVHSYKNEWDATIADATKAIELNSKEGSYFVERGDAYSRLKKYDAALADFSEALEIYPNDVSALTGRGDVYRFTLKRREALADYNAAIAQGQEMGLAAFFSSDALFGRAHLFMGEQKFTLAIRDLDELLKTRRSPEAYSSRALAHRLLGHDDAAIADYSELLKMNSRDTEALENRGSLYLKKGNRDAAKSDFQALIKIDPNNEKAKKELVTLDPHSASDFIEVARKQTNDKKYDDAINTYNEALRLEPGNAQAYSGRASAHLQKSEHDLAIADYSKAIELDPKDLGSHNGRAASYAAKGDLDHAIADYGEVIKGPDASKDVGDTVIALTGRADGYTKQGKSELALADYNKAITVAAGDSLYNYIFGPDALLGRARLELAAGKKDLAIADLQAALKLNAKHEAVKAELDKLVPPEPTTADDFLKQALERGRNNDAPGAFASLSKCIELKPDAMPCYVLRGQVSVIQGNDTAAMNDLRKAVELQPQHPAPHMGLGVVYMKMARKDEAVREFRRVLELNPNATEAKNALQQLGVQP